MTLRVIWEVHREGEETSAAESVRGEYWCRTKGIAVVIPEER